jgi:hypothetical protein
MNTAMTHERLREENQTFAGTGGISAGNHSHGFVPGFCDTQTGRVRISRFSNGTPAPMHLLDGLPEEWITARDPAGRVAAIKPTVMAGFIRQNRFYTREQAAKVVLH